jgi:hypothetical protein
MEVFDINNPDREGVYHLPNGFLQPSELHPGKWLAARFPGGAIRDERGVALYDTPGDALAVFEQREG